MACPGRDATVSLLPGRFHYDGIENITSLVERNSIFGEGGIGTFAAGVIQKLEFALWVLFCTVLGLVGRLFAAVLELSRNG